MTFEHKPAYGNQYAKKHGDSRTRLYKCWRSMKARCYNPNNNRYYCYGAIGIEVAAEWIDNYLVFKVWALANGYRNDFTLDRLNAGDNYEPSNCRWISKPDNSSRTIQEIRDRAYEEGYEAGLSGQTIQLRGLTTQPYRKERR